MGNSLQEYYEELRKKLSVRANLILDLYGFEKATEVLHRLADKRESVFLRKWGIGTMEEIQYMVFRLRDYNDTLNGSYKIKDDLQEYYIGLLKRLSVRANNILRVGGFEKATDVLSHLTDKKKILLLRKCGHKTMEEIQEMVFRLREFYSSLNEISENNKESIQRQVTIQELSPSEVQLIQSQYEKLLNSLSVRTYNIAKAHGFLQWKNFEPYLNSTEEVFLLYENCGKKSAQELLLLATGLKNILCEACNRNNNNAALNEPNTNIIENNQKQEVYQSQPFLYEQVIQAQYEKLLINLSLRSYNIVKSNGFLQWQNFEPYLNSTEEQFLLLNNCGKKSAHELLVLASELQKIIPKNTSQRQYRIENEFMFIDTIQFTEIEEGFLLFFHNKYNHWPMLFLSGKCVQSVFSKQELMAIDGEKTELPQGLTTLSNYRIQQIVDKTLKKILYNPVLKKLRNHPDWKYYDVYNFSSFFYSWNGNTTIASKKNIENYAMLDYISEKPAPVQNQFHRNGNHLGIYDSITICFLFQIFGLTCYYANLEKKRIYPYYTFPQNVHFSFYIDIKYTSFKYNRALSEVCRLMKVKTEEDILIPIVSYFIDNNYYWDDTFSHSDEDRRNIKGILVELFQRICNAEIQSESLYIKANFMDYSNQLYEILRDAGERLNKEELLRQLKQRCQEKGFSCNLTDSTRLSPYITKDPRFVSIGKSGFWGLKEWEEETGSIRGISIQIVKEAKQPIHINDLIELVKKKRPDSNGNSISSIIRQTAFSGELLLFYDDYIGYPRKKYIGEYIIMPKTFEDWLMAFREFVIKNKRFPYSTEDGYEGYLYRWYYRASQLTELTSEEILKIDALEKELSNYPHNATEYSFLQKCDLFKKFVEGNKRMLTKDDDVELFNWFYKSSRNYSTLNDNREKYFSQLLQYISNILY